MISVCFQGKPFNITVIQDYALTSNAEEAEVERFYEDLQELLELTPQKDVLFIIGDWNAKGGSQEIRGVTDKFGLGVQNEAGQRLTEFCQENVLIIANTLFQQHKRRHYTWPSPGAFGPVGCISHSEAWRNPAALWPLPVTTTVAQTEKHLPTMWETQVQSLGREDLLEKEMATHSSILAWKIQWTEDPGRLQSMRSRRVGHD